MMLVARKPLRYGGRSLKPGDTFEVQDQFRRHAVLLKAVGKADDAPPAPPQVKAPIVQTLPPDEDDDLADLRSEYSKVSGQDADGRWGAARLRIKIDEARRTYQRRDMTAED